MHVTSLALDSVGISPSAHIRTLATLVTVAFRRAAAFLLASPAVEPEQVQVSRWRRAMAQYSVGHQERIKRITERLSELPGLRLAGNAYEGIGIPDCIRMGRRAAKELVGQFVASSSWPSAPSVFSRKLVSKKSWATPRFVREK
jgi:hypothetical protein